MKTQGQDMQALGIFVEEWEIVEITDLTYDGQTDPDGIAAGITFFEPLEQLICRYGRFSSGVDDHQSLMGKDHAYCTHPPCRLVMTDRITDEVGKKQVGQGCKKRQIYVIFYICLEDQ